MTSMIPSKSSLMLTSALAGVVLLLTPRFCETNIELAPLLLLDANVFEKKKVLT
jgi:hypothetical protein